MIFDGFENIYSEYHKPLWQWRVITLSKKNKSVEDGMQKLKEGDVVLQAEVYGILARASGSKQQQLQSYMKAIEVCCECIVYVLCIYSVVCIMYVYICIVYVCI